jgi:hypothetical protein
MNRPLRAPRRALLALAASAGLASLSGLSGCAGPSVQDYAQEKPCWTCASTSTAR